MKALVEVEELNALLREMEDDPLRGKQFLPHYIVVFQRALEQSGKMGASDVDGKKGVLWPRHRCGGLTGQGSDRNLVWRASGRRRL